MDETEIIRAIGQMVLELMPQYEQACAVQMPVQQYDFPLVFVNREGEKTPTF
jgi:hypothetical protein